MRYETIIIAQCVNNKRKEKKIIRNSSNYEIWDESQCVLCKNYYNFIVYQN